MLTAEQSLEFILGKVEELGDGAKTHHRAAYRALLHLTQRWAEPTDSFIDDGLEMAERIGQDLADVQRHIADLQHAYLKALFGDTGD
ncbi:MAG: hypothetical protein V3S87_13410 [Alphaproteobacteria bacterium]